MAALLPILRKPTIISRETVARYPLRTFLHFARNTFDQLTHFDVRFNKMEANSDYSYFGNIFGPKSQSRLENSLQSRGLVPFGLINAWLNAVVVASILLLVVAWARLRNDDRYREIFFFAFGIALFLIGNAAITGGLSGVWVPISGARRLAHSNDGSDAGRDLCESKYTFSLQWLGRSWQLTAVST